jgi:hypothetical protein
MKYWSPDLKTFLITNSQSLEKWKQRLPSTLPWFLAVPKDKYI